MKSLRTYLVAILLLLCLPVQALAVAAMPLCHAMPGLADMHAISAENPDPKSHCAEPADQAMQASMADANMAHQHGEHVDALPTTDTDAPDHSKQQACEHCAICAATASYGVLTISQPPLLACSAQHAVHASSRHYPTIISQPFHPPRLA